MTERCQRCDIELGKHRFCGSEFGTMCMPCFDDYFELHKKIDLLKLEFIAGGRRQL